MNRREPLVRRTVLVLVLLVIAAGPVSAAGPAKKGVRPGEMAPAFAGASTSGVAFQSGDLLSRNRAILVAFWGIRCSACIEEIPALRKLQEEFREGVLQVVGVNTDGVDAATLKAMMDEEKISTNYIVLTDPEFKVADAFVMTAAPLTVLIDREGKVRYVHEGYKPGDELPLRTTILDVVK